MIRPIIDKLESFSMSKLFPTVRKVCYNQSAYFDSIAKNNCICRKQKLLKIFVVFQQALLCIQQWLCKIQFKRSIFQKLLSALILNYYYLGSTTYVYALCILIKKYAEQVLSIHSCMQLYTRTYKLRFQLTGHQPVYSTQSEQYVLNMYLVLT